MTILELILIALHVFYGVYAAMILRVAYRYLKPAPRKQFFICLRCSKQVVRNKPILRSTHCCVPGEEIY